MKFVRFDQKELSSEMALKNLLKKRILKYLVESKAVLSMDARMVRKIQSLMEKANKTELEALYFALGVEKKGNEEIEQRFMKKVNDYCEEFLVLPLRKLGKSI